MAKRVLNAQDIRARLQGLREWLSPPDREWNYMVLDRVDFTTTRYPGTSNWFSPSLRSFFDSADDSIMVVIGAPGVGKSTLSGWILDEFETEPDKNDRLTLYFHIRHHENSKCTTFDIVRGFLLQLVEAKIETPALFERLLDIHKNSVQEHVIPDSEEDLWLVFRLVAATVKDLVMVIDGLDELIDVHNGPILLFEQLVKVADNARERENTFKVVVTTRPPYTVTSAHTRQYNIEQSDTATDVATTVAHNINLLEEFQGLHPEVRSDISAKVIHGADGMFLWANIIVQGLRNRQSSEDIETMLKSAPKDLDELYDRMLSSLDLKSEDTRRTFSWLLVAARPLHMDELAIVLTTEPGREAAKKRKSDIAEDVCKACGPLIKIDGGFVRFVHVSLKQYMEGKPF
ncbi:hypothetical protein DER46DRAFT_578650 [Fusarium sp. MPI-SDFR-AT-0072]|nr:hypothetical protein DER46DRAFT_578650 [Fusarium sp. MPI-SDFR-AT-0072]